MSLQFKCLLHLLITKHFSQGLIHFYNFKQASVSNKVILLASHEMSPEKIAYQKLQALHNDITLAVKEALIATISL
jgi:hypothetical protein